MRTAEKPPFRPARCLIRGHDPSVGNHEPLALEPSDTFEEPLNFAFRRLAVLGANQVPIVDFRPDQCDEVCLPAGMPRCAIRMAPW